MCNSQTAFTALTVCLEIFEAEQQRSVTGTWQNVPTAGFVW